MSSTVTEKERLQLVNRYNTAAIHMLRGAAEADAAAGLSRSRLSALSIIIFAGPLTLKRLAELEGVTPASMSRLVDTLVEDALIEKLPHPEDGRAVLLSATAAGSALFKKARSSRLQYLAGRMGELTEAQFQTLNAAVDMLLERFASHRVPEAEE